jgi:hypothetical protein
VPGRLGAREGALAALLLAAPRLLRMALGVVRVEDEGYLNAALMLRLGFTPYAEVPLLNFPLLDGLLAGVVAVVGPSLRAIEALTALAAFVVSWQVFRLGRRLGGPRAGWIAGLLVAWSPLVARYHLFEREPFLLVPLLAAVALALEPPSPRRALAQGGLLAAALLVKLTALGAAAALLAWVAVRHGRASALRAAAACAAVMAVAIFACAAAWGSSFVGSVFVFRLVRAPQELAEKLSVLRQSIDLAAVLGLAAVAFLIGQRQAGRAALPLALLAGTATFVVLLNPGLWVHNQLELLPWLALLAALAEAPAPGRRGRLAAVAAVGTALAVAAGGFGLDRRAAYRAPFDGAARSDLAAAAAAVGAHAGPATRVAGPGVVAFVAGRVEVIPYPEIGPLVAQVNAATAREGALGAVRALRQPGQRFWPQVAQTLGPEVGRQVQAIARGGVPVVVTSTVPILVVYPPRLLEQAGYAPVHQNARYVVWRAPGGVS